MIEISKNLWDAHHEGNWVVITTNGLVKNDGLAVMGRGVALQAKMWFKNLPKELGKRIKKHGNHVFMFPEYRLFTFPVKSAWYQMAKLDLIAQSADELKFLMDAMPDIESVYIPRPGCGNGKLDWETVKPVLDFVWDDRFIVVTPPFDTTGL